MHGNVSLSPLFVLIFVRCLPLYLQPFKARVYLKKRWRQWGLGELSVMDGSKSMQLCNVKKGKPTSSCQVCGAAMYFLPILAFANITKRQNI